MRTASSVLLRITCAVLFAGVLSAPVIPSAGAAADADTGKIVVYRDEYGVPHLYADTPEQACYAMGWAQAEDRLEELRFVAWAMTTGGPDTADV